MTASDSTQKPVLITGASRGLGAALAETIASHRHVIAVARTTGALEELDDRIQAAGGSATLAPMDVTDTGAMAHLCRSIYDRWGSLHMWCHTAVHAPPLTPADHMDGRDFDKTVALNITATAKLIPMVAPLLQNGGKAVFFDDPQAGRQFFGAYGSSKAAQIAMARSWAAEAVSTGADVRIVTPNPMPTAIRARFYPGEDRAVLADPRVEAQRLLAEIGFGA